MFNKKTIKAFKKLFEEKEKEVEAPNKTGYFYTDNSNVCGVKFKNVETEKSFQANFEMPEKPFVAPKFEETQNVVLNVEYLRKILDTFKDEQYLLFEFQPQSPVLIHGNEFCFILAPCLKDDNEIQKFLEDNNRPLEEKKE